MMNFSQRQLYCQRQWAISKRSLENEFDIWKSVLSSSTAGIILLLIVVILYLQRKNNAKFLQLSEKCLQFKIKIKNIEKKTANLINNE